MLSRFKSKSFLIIIAPALLLIIWVLVKYFSTGELATPSNSASEIARKFAILENWLVLRNITFNFYIVYFVISSLMLVMAKQKNSSIRLGNEILKRFLIALGGAILSLFTFVISAILFDLFSIILTLINNPSAITKQSGS